jgi:hypothetical protein
VGGLWFFVPVNTLPGSVGSLLHPCYTPARHCKAPVGHLKNSAYSENSDLRNYFVEATASARSFAAGGLVTFEAPKGTKTAVSRNASLRSKPLPCKTAKTWAGFILPRRSRPSHVQKHPMPCHRTTHHRFGRFRPKLPLLTLWGRQGVFSVMKFAAKILLILKF